MFKVKWQNLHYKTYNKVLINKLFEIKKVCKFFKTTQNFKIKNNS